MRSRMENQETERIETKKDILEYWKKLNTEFLRDFERMDKESREISMPKFARWIKREIGRRNYKGYVKN